MKLRTKSAQDIFFRNINPKEGTEWGIYYTLTDLGGAALAFLGGYVASIYGFTHLIILVSFISLSGAFVLIPIRTYLKK